MLQILLEKRVIFHIEMALDLSSMNQVVTISKLEELFISLLVLKVSIISMSDT